MEAQSKTTTQWEMKLSYVSELYHAVDSTPDQQPDVPQDTTRSRVTETLYLCTEEEDKTKPLVLGAGSYAVVVLAANSAVATDKTDFFAIKLLRKDTESKIYSDIGQMRFYTEVMKTRKFRGNDPYLVSYFGFGRTKVTAGAARTREDEVELETEYNPELTDIITANDEQKVHDFLEAGLQVTLMGDFYVMRAATRTLGDFLLHEFPWYKNAVYVSGSSALFGLNRLRTKGDDRAEEAAKVRDALKIEFKEDDKSGLGILRAIDNANPQFANKAIMDLFEKMLEPIVDLHRRQEAAEGDQHEQRAGWAHRDIKPHNFLMDFDAPDMDYNVKATDLGFVIGTSDAGQKETLSSTKDPGVLAPGSYLYRAPEQMESRYQVLFECPADEAVGQITFLNIGDMNVEEGDLFESDNFFIEEQGAGDPGVPVRTTITKAIPSSGKWILEFKERLKARASQVLYSGDIVKMTGQHTDLFSLGAALYLLASGGKNPEKFYVKYLEDVPYGANAVDEELQAISRSCFTIAMSLCLQPWTEITKDAERIYETLLTNEDRSFLANYQSSQGPVTIKRSFLGLLETQTKQPDKGLASYLTAMRKNPALRYYSTNKNDRPIPFCILFEIVRLMVRGKKHSYVQDVRADGRERREGYYGYFALDLSEKARECRQWCMKAAQFPDLQYDVGAHKEVGKTMTEIVFVFRVLFDAIAGRTQDGNALGAPGEDALVEGEPKQERGAERET